MLPLVFADPTDYDKIGSRDKLSVLGLPPVPGKNLTVQGKKPDGSTYEFAVNHTYNENQLGWFKHGSALNAMAAAKK